MNRNHNILFFPFLILVTLLMAVSAFAEPYCPFKRDAYLTSSFGENRGTRYHAGFDYSTEMEEGWVIYAPENGTVKELRVSPFGYGKVMFFAGESGKTWVFAHQSSFGKLDSLVEQKQLQTKKNDVTLKPGVSFKKGDTLTFAGSSGIGNPHLHLEIRQDKDLVINPALLGVQGLDTIAPQIFGIALWQQNELAITNEAAFSKGCAITPVNNETSLSMAVKIADYSREPKSNPMAIRSLELWRYDEKIYSKRLDTLNYKNMINIRDELLWAEEADTAGDWHYIRADIAQLSTYKLIIEDFAGHVTTREFTIHPSCSENAPLAQKLVQTAPVYTFLSRTMLDLSKCSEGFVFEAIGKCGKILSGNICEEFGSAAIPLGKIAEKHPQLQFINYSKDSSTNKIAVYPFRFSNKLNWTANLDSAKISVSVPKAGYSNDTSLQVLAITRTHTDSLDFYEIHPKGLQFRGNAKICLEEKRNKAPLYWLGETSRNWFIFSKQTGKEKSCASLNELRDVAKIENKNAPKLGFAYWSNSHFRGELQPALKIPVLYAYDGIANGNSINVSSNGKWIPAEFDSEPREIVLEGAKLPEAGETLTIQIEDEAKNKANYEIVIPEM